MEAKYAVPEHTPRNIMGDEYNAFGHPKAKITCVDQEECDGWVWIRLKVNKDTVGTYYKWYRLALEEEITLI